MLMQRVDLGANRSCHGLNAQTSSSCHSFPSLDRDIDDGNRAQLKVQITDYRRTGAYAGAFSIIIAGQKPATVNVNGALKLRSFDRCLVRHDSADNMTVTGSYALYTFSNSLQ